MNSPKIPQDELFQVELRIAQRADELARLYGSDPTHALAHWRQAEREFWREPLTAQDMEGARGRLCSGTLT